MKTLFIYFLSLTLPLHFLTIAFYCHAARVEAMNKYLRAEVLITKGRKKVKLEEKLLENSFLLKF